MMNKWDVYVRFFPEQDKFKQVGENVSYKQATDDELYWHQVAISEHRQIETKIVKVRQNEEDNRKG